MEKEEREERELDGTINLQASHVLGEVTRNQKFKNCAVSQDSGVATFGSRPKSCHLEILQWLGTASRVLMLGGG